MNHGVFDFEASSDDDYVDQGGDARASSHIPGDRSSHIALRNWGDIAIAILDALPMGALLLDSENNVLALNKTFARWYEASGDEKKLHEWLDEILEESGPTSIRNPAEFSFMQHVTLHLAEPYGTRNMTVRQVRLENSERLIMLQDVTEELTSDDRRRANAELRALLAAINDLIMVIDIQGEYLQVAPTAPELLYRASTELVGKNVRDVFPPDLADQFLENAHTVVQAGKVLSMEYTVNVRGRDTIFLGTISRLSDSAVLFVTRDITERRAVEAALERNIRQEELIRAQSSLLEQLSTPLIPISDDVVVVPLIGTLDAVRVQRVLDTLIVGISSKGSKTAIIDVTGVPAMDGAAADGLLRISRAARLLGARVIFTGIGPEVARTLVEIGSELGGLVTTGTLQHGIEKATRKNVVALPKRRI
jgi:PAS domain S-box-containing protein